MVWVRRGLCIFLSIIMIVGIAGCGSGDVGNDARNETGNGNGTYPVNGSINGENGDGDGNGEADGNGADDENGALDENDVVEVVPLVGAYYYGWYGKPGQWDGAITHAPVMGKYDSHDQAILSKHIEWGREAGIDFFVHSWRLPGVFEDVALDVYLQLSDPIPAVIHYESALALDKTDMLPIDFDSEIETGVTRGRRFLEHMDYVARYFDSPAYFKLDGRPVVVFYIARDWVNFGPYLAELKDNMAELGHDLYMIADLVWWTDPAHVPLDWDDSAAGFDAITAYNMYDWAQPSAMADYWDFVREAWLPYRAQADALDLGFIPNVMPGWNDCPLRGDWRPVMSREDGDFYRQSWDLAREFMTEELPLVFITSFNEWHEGTELEPSYEFGSSYLHLTRELREVPLRFE